MGAVFRPHAPYGGIPNGHTNESKGRSSAEKEFSRSPGGHPILGVRGALGDRVHYVYPGPHALFPVYQFHRLERPDRAKMGWSSKLYQDFHPIGLIQSLVTTICHLQHSSLLSHCLFLAVLLNEGTKGVSFRTTFYLPTTFRRAAAGCGSDFNPGLARSMDFSDYLVSKAQAGSAIPNLPCGTDHELVERGWANAFGYQGVQNFYEAADRYAGLFWNITLDAQPDHLFNLVLAIGFKPLTQLT
jgi:hypothetical protein